MESAKRQDERAGQPPFGNDNMESSNPETLREEQSSDTEPDSEHEPESEPSPSQGEHAAGLRGQLAAYERQIRQLKDARRAVQKDLGGKRRPVSQSEASQGSEGSEGSPMESIPTADAANPVSSRTHRGSTHHQVPKGGDMRPMRSRAPIQRAETGQPFRGGGGPNADWVDDDYFDDNPWYGQQPGKPVFSLGKPLPHKIRGPAKKKQDEEKADEAGTPSGDPEKGEAGVERERTAPSGKTGRAGSGQDRLMQGFEPTEGMDPRGMNTRSHKNQDNPGGGIGHEDAERGGTGWEQGDKYNIGNEPVGQREDDEVVKGQAEPDEVRNWWARFRSRYPEPLAEFLATFMSVFLGVSATLSVNLSKNQSTQYGTYETACWAWGFAFMFGIYIGGGVSGAHMNPAISVSLSAFRGFPWRQCLMYVMVQTLASIAGGALAMGLNYKAIDFVDPARTVEYTSFYAYPQIWVDDATAFFNQFVASAVMMVAIFALGDDQNNPPGAGMHAFILGLLITTLKFCLGYNTGSALNPATDFGPRLMAYAIGYREAKTFLIAWWFWGPWLATVVGSLFGAAAYDFFIFVGSESPVNYRVPLTMRNTAENAKWMVGAGPGKEKGKRGEEKEKEGKS